MHHVWIIAAVGCLLAALVSWWKSSVDWVFVFATLGVVAWFLEKRNQMQSRIIEEETDFTMVRNNDSDEEQRTD